MCGEAPWAREMPAPRALTSRPGTFVSESTALGGRFSLGETISPKPRPPPRSDAPVRSPQSLLRRRLVHLGDLVLGVCRVPGARLPLTAHFPAARAAGARISVASRLPASLFYALTCPLPGVMRSPRVIRGPRPHLLTREPLKFLLRPREFIPCSFLSPFRLLLRGRAGRTEHRLPFLFSSFFLHILQPPKPSSLPPPFLPRNVGDTRAQTLSDCLRFHQGVAGKRNISLGWSC